jgi:hypothetical protein
MLSQIPQSKEKVGAPQFSPNKVIATPKADDTEVMQVPHEDQKYNEERADR